MTKLTQGHLDLHSKASSIDLGFLADQVSELCSDELNGMSWWSSEKCQYQH
jgi:hypothetical protein